MIQLCYNVINYNLEDLCWSNRTEWCIEKSDFTVLNHNKCLGDKERSTIWIKDLDLYVKINISYIQKNDEIKTSNTIYWFSLYEKYWVLHTSKYPLLFQLRNGTMYKYSFWFVNGYNINRSDLKKKLIEHNINHILIKPN